MKTNRNRWMFGILFLTALIQLAAPVWLIASSEIVLRFGQSYRFRTRPVDPVDYFRGRYMTFSLDQTTATLAGPAERVKANAFACAHLVRTEDGFASVTAVSAAPPPEGDWLRVRVESLVESKEGSSYVRFASPIDRFYMEEGSAVDAQTWMNEERDRARKANRQRIEARRAAGEKIDSDEEWRIPPDLLLTAWLDARVRQGKIQLTGFHIGDHTFGSALMK